MRSDKSEIDLLYEILEEQRRGALKREIELQLLKMAVIQNPQDVNLVKTMNVTEKLMASDKMVLRIIRQRIKETEKN